MINKKEIRSEILIKRKNLAAKDVKSKSEEIVQNIANLKEFINSDVVYSYFSLKNEVDLLALIEICNKNNKVLLYPKVTSDSEMEFFIITSVQDFNAGYMGILEPKIDCEIYNNKSNMYSDNSIMLIPGTAFDLMGNRMGMGKGYYDRYIISHNNDIKHKVGIGYGFQIFETIPCEAHDIRMDMVITENGIIMSPVS